MSILLNSLIISAWCLGFRTITDDGMLLNWLRRPFEDENRFILFLECFVDFNNRIAVSLSNIIFYLMKPIILCVVCFPSVHGAFIYYYFHGWEWQMIISIVFSCFINSFVWNLYEKIRQ